MYRIFIVIVSFLFWGCASEEELISELELIAENVSTEENHVIPSNPIELGRLNAVKKAYQMTDIVFTPILPIEANSMIYDEGKTYKGLIYSSVKELGTYVGSNISFHTFMTAIHNPHSKIYTDKLNQTPYHGINCKAYYGTVCSGLVSYALDLEYGSYDFPVSVLMEELDKQNIDSIHIADVLWKSGHVAIITNVIRDKNNHVKRIEISEAIQTGCRRYTISDAYFISLLNSTYQNVYRYKEIDKNYKYISATEFVPVLDETPSLYIYNDALCIDKGDEACYSEEEEVVINIFREYNYLDIFRNEEHILRFDSSSERNIILNNLPFGDYKACICYGETNIVSNFTLWKVINMNLIPDKSTNRLYFSSENAIPYKISFSDINGSRSYPHTQLFSYKLSDEDRNRGYIDIPIELTMKERPYIHFSFSTEYGIVQHRPINWFE